MLLKIVILTILAHSQALPFFILDEGGQQYVILPINRAKRDTTLDISKLPNGGTIVNVEHKGMIDLGNSNHKLSVEGFAKQQFDPKGPITAGGTVAYQNVPAGTSLKAEVARTPVWGTDVSVQGTKTLFESGGAKLEALAGFQQHIGGLPGTKKGDPSVGLTFKYAPQMPLNDLFYLLCRMNRKLSNSIAKKC